MTKLENESQKQSIFKRFFVGNSYCWLACLCTAGVMMLVYYCYNLFPFGETTSLRMGVYGVLCAVGNRAVLLFSNDSGCRTAGNGVREKCLAAYGAGMEEQPYHAVGAVGAGFRGV